MHRHVSTRGRISGLGALSLFSILLLGAAFVAPEEIGIRMTALGLVTLLALRLRAMAAGWAPRGLAWSRGSYQPLGCLASSSVSGVSGATVV